MFLLSLYSKEAETQKVWVTFPKPWQDWAISYDSNPSKLVLEAVFLIIVF